MARSLAAVGAAGPIRDRPTMQGSNHDILVDEASFF
jgi:hypothetical protein